MNAVDNVQDEATRDAASPRLRAEESLGYQVNLAARLFARALAMRVEPLGLAPGQFPVLLALWESEGRTQGELCRLVQVEQPTMANTLARMERDGLIQRKPDPRDRRRTVIRLTTRGRDLESPAVASARSINARALESLTSREQSELRRMLGIIAANLSLHPDNATQQEETP
ncbi:transcriptional regulator [Desulfocurvibacter africanus PCS]|uniref:Transcriptional regulator n=1 Tax=Desulfocurvibacter africanus PCS TaxID=1262666 RepID=M5Q380_DESAF|nr:MarR family transcriptional regulator [Desulfocurvibacter africanus]EMG38033.1 transcriptional regulator [Desulfocurvibacter africanus PCS]